LERDRQRKERAPARENYFSFHRLSRLGKSQSLQKSPPGEAGMEDREWRNCQLLVAIIL
jgi:hypothetical protein